MHQLDIIQEYLFAITQCNYPRHYSQKEISHHILCLCRRRKLELEIDNKQRYNKISLIILYIFQS